MKFNGKSRQCLAIAAAFLAVATATPFAHAVGAREAHDLPIGAPPSVDPSVIVLAALVLIIGLWSWILHRKVDHQSRTISAHSESEARIEQHNVQLETRRS